MQHGCVRPAGISNDYFLLSERGFAVLRYDKRGIGENGTIINNSVWGNMTSNDLIHDAEKAVNVLIQQPEVDAKRITIIGHSEGGAIVTRVAIDNPITKIKNIVLMDARIQDAYAYIAPIFLPNDLIRVWLLSLSISLASGVFPAWKASRLSPLVAMRV